MFLTRKFSLIFLHFFFILTQLLVFLFFLRGGRERKMDWSRSQALRNGKGFLLFYILSFSNHHLSVYGIQISNNNCLSWMSSHISSISFHLRAFSVSLLLIIIYSYGVQTGLWDETWHLLSSLLSGPSCLTTWGFTIINCLTWK